MHINVLISSLDLFAAVNAVFARMFGTSPPTRACVAVDLPELVFVQMDCLAYDTAEMEFRKPIHVQGLSYWAPANIGPYSQSITVDPKPRCIIKTDDGLRLARSSPSQGRLLLYHPLCNYHHPLLSRQKSLWHFSITTVLLKLLGWMLNHKGAHSVSQP
jgi:hypothetical protein